MKSYEKSLGISNTVLYFVQTGLAIYVWTLDEHIFFKSHFKMSGLPWFLRCCLKHRWILSNSSGLELEVPRSPGATISMALCSLDVGSVPCQPESPTGWCTVPEIQVLTNISMEASCVREIYPFATPTSLNNDLRSACHYSGAIPIWRFLLIHDFEIWCARIFHWYFVLFCQQVARLAILVHGQRQALGSLDLSFHGSKAIEPSRNESGP